MYQNTSQRVNVANLQCKLNENLQVQAKANQLQRGQKKHKVNKQLQSAKHPNKTTTINYKAHEKTGIKHNKKCVQAQRKQLTTKHAKKKHLQMQRKAKGRRMRRRRRRRSKMLIV